ncbi:MAG: pantetheine-phosphate adenylyltransferase, partial [Butyricicoccus sp.]
MKTAIYPGSFDPVTLGHLDIIERAAALFDRLVVVVMHNQNKRPAFTPEERVDMIRRVTAGLPNVEVRLYDGLLANYADEVGACTIVKGLRAVSDFDNEFQMAPANRRLNRNVDTAFLMTSAKYMFLSSS